MVELSLDMQNAPVPERKYYAHGVAVIASPENVQVVFGQRTFTESGRLRSMPLRLFCRAPRISMKPRSGNA